MENTNYAIRNQCEKTGLLVNLSDKINNINALKSKTSIYDRCNLNINKLYNHKFRNDFKIIHMNTRSLYPSKIDNLRLLARELNPQIICISESWLTDSIPDVAVNLTNYNIYRYDSSNNYGSVCIYTLNNLTTKVIKIPDIICTHNFDFLVLSVQWLKHKSFIVAAIYIHPPVNTQTFDELVRLLRHLSTLNKKIYVLGDFNINLLDNKTNFSIKLKTFLATNKLIQVIKEPTRITETTKTLIDLCITNDKNINYAKSICENNLADHNTIMISLDLLVQKPSYFITKTFRTKKNYRISDFNLILKDQHFNSLYSINDLNAAAKTFNELFIKSLNMVSPLVTKTFKHKISIPFPKYLIKKRIEKNRLHKIAQNENSTNNDWFTYKCFKKNLDKEIKCYRSSYLHKKLTKCKHNPKQLWANLGQITPMKEKTNSFLNTMYNLETANAFNIFFSSVGEKTFIEVENMLSDSMIKPPNNTHNYPEFSLKLATSIEINDVIRSLKNSNSIGVDEITTNFIKDATDSITSIITYLINSSLMSNVVPEIWKTAIVIPIYKKSGVKSNPANYRPISILPVLSKILEKVVAKQLLTHLEKYNIIDKRQFGFRLNSSTSNAINYICNSLYTSLDKNMISLLVLLDLSKAFDSISHEMLLETLHMYNLKSQWFTNYLTNRFQKTKIGEIFSNITNINYGVPQGSVLGPVLFIIYINEIFTILKEFNDKEISCDIVGYADDTQIIFTSEFCNYNKLIKYATKVTNKLVQRFAELRLKINTKKSQCMLICSKSQNNKINKSTKYIIINNDKIEFFDSVNNLGIILDSDMKFKTHLNNLHKRIFNKLTYINKTKHFHTFLTRKLLVEHLALSPLNYCRDTWGTFTRHQASQIQGLINFGAKIIFRKGKYDRASDLIIKLNWLNPDQTSKYFLSCTVYKHLNKLINNNISDSLILNPGIVTRNSSSKYIIPNTNNKYGERSLNFRVAFIWNSIPESIKFLSNIYQFKRALKTYLLSDKLSNI